MSDIKILNAIMDMVFEKYETSPDFNGLCAAELIHDEGLNEETVRSIIIELTKKDRIAISCGGNPHIMAFKIASADKQIEILSKYSLNETCLYPSTAVLAQRVDAGAYADRPFTKELKLGAGQLEPKYFKYEVLERYSRDPRYKVTGDGTNGNVTVAGDGMSISDEDYVYLDFGYGYTKDDNKQQIIIAFPIYLHKLPSKHQQYWNTYRLPSGLMDSDFVARTLKGEFTENYSVYDAILQEMREINILCKKIGWPPMFKGEFEEGVPNDKYGPLKRSTQREYGEFAHVLSKVVLENMDREFFKKFVSIIDVGVDAKGCRVDKNKGIIRLFTEWLDAVKYRPATEDAIPEIVWRLKKVNQERGKEAHNLYEDNLDPKWGEKQKELVTCAWEALEAIRLVLSSHPKAAGYVAPDWIEECKIKY